MSKLKRDARAFAMRVKMGTDQLWLIVEGRSHDRAFYDRVLEGHHLARAGGYSIRLAEQIRLNDKSSGGKQFARALFDFFEAESLLTQESKAGARHVVAFALDKDLDVLAGDTINSPHVMYTAGMDVEAEILRHADLQRAACATYSLPLRQVSAILNDEATLFSQLAHLWRHWITEGAVCICSRRRAAPHRYSQVSSFNAGAFGPVNNDAVREARSAIEADLLADEVNHLGASLRSAIDDIFESGQEWRLVKGRWMTKYVSHMVVGAVGREEVEANIPPGTLAKAAIPLLPDDGDWARHYWKRLDALLAA
jgi:hypothetical protein